MVPPFTARAIVGRRSKYLVIVFWLAVELGRPAGVLAHSSEVRNRRADDDGAMGPTGEPHRAELPAGMGSPVVVIAEAGSAAPARNLLGRDTGHRFLDAPGRPERTGRSRGNATASTRQPGRVRRDRPPELVFCILAIVLRALVAPLISMATVILSVAGHAGVERLRLHPRVRVRRSRLGPSPLHLRVPRGARHRRQHLPHDPGAPGVEALGHRAGCAHGARRNRWRHQLRRFRAGRDLRRPGNDAPHHLRRNRVLRGLRVCSSTRSWSGLSSRRR